MKLYIRYILLFSIVSLSIGSNAVVPHLESIKSKELNETIQILAVMVEFVEDNDPRTTGNGKFLTSVDESIYYYEQDEKRCDGFLLDKPPHNKQYFEDQLEAAKNYYLNISNNSIDFSYHVIDEVYQLDKTILEYSQISSYDNSNESIAQLFVDALDKADDDIDSYLEDNELEESEVLIVVFHAGVGEDYGFDGYIDPANYDIRSAYIDSEITSFFPDSLTVTKGILMPETLNLLYYNTIEDIYGYQGQGLCDIQIGMTGLFTYLLGYEFGLSEMFNRDTGKTGLGVFELMDIGSFNGRGTIPAPPQAWSRIQMGWESSELLDTPSSSYVVNRNRFSDDDGNSSVHRINISQDEYFLLESVNNNIIEGQDDYDISEISYLDTVASIYIPDTLISIFDRLIYLDESIDDIVEYGTECSENAKITISSTTNVILCAKNYDYGLPGDGMMIWRINEANIDNLNDDIESRTVELMEADGAQDIGYQNYFYPIANPSIGWMWDLWFEENEAYFSVNTDQNAVEINSYTMPSTYSQSGSRSLVSISDIKKLASSPSMKFKFDYEDDIFNQVLMFNSADIPCIGVSYLYSDIYLLFFDVGTEICIIDVSVNGALENPASCFEYGDYQSGDFIYFDTEVKSCTQSEYYNIHQNACISLDGYIPKGYFSSSNTLEDIPEQFRNIDLSRLAIGDIDQDGLDEIIEGTDSYITCYNPNGSICNGFPVLGSYHGNIVIGNLGGDEDEYPEIIVRSDGVINFISHDGELDYQISSQSLSDLYLSPIWISEPIVALVDGNRLLNFNINNVFSGNIYWAGPNGGYNNQPDVSGPHESPDYSAQSGISVFYNYPNPTKDDRTSFRFFIPESEKAEIKIYSSSGFLVKKISDITFTANEYNEVLWDVSDQLSGLYLANLIIYDNGKQSDSKFAKVLVGSK